MKKPSPIKLNRTLMLMPVLLLAACAPTAQIESNPVVTDRGVTAQPQSQRTEKRTEKVVVADSATASFELPEAKADATLTERAENVLKDASELAADAANEAGGALKEVASDAANAVEDAATVGIGFERVPYLSKVPVRQFSAPQQVIEEGREYRAVLNTERGPITLDLNSKAAPKAVNNFVFLSLNRFYDGTRFHRVMEGFMAQVGDPNTTDFDKKPIWGQGGPGYNFMYEVDDRSVSFGKAGVVGMARATSPSSQGSQFFMTLADARFLDGDYTIFGQVVDGMDNLQAITKTGANFLEAKKYDTLNSVEIYVK